MVLVAGTRSDILKVGLCTHFLGKPTNTFQMLRIENGILQVYERTTYKVNKSLNEDIIQKMNRHQDLNPRVLINLPA